jgi:hypothetical protein
MARRVGQRELQRLEELLRLQLLEHVRLDDGFNLHRVGIAHLAEHRRKHRMSCARVGIVDQGRARIGLQRKAHRLAKIRSRADAERLGLRPVNLCRKSAAADAEDSPRQYAFAGVPFEVRGQIVMARVLELKRLDGLGERLDGSTHASRLFVDRRYPKEVGLYVSAHSLFSLGDPRMVSIS